MNLSQFTSTLELGLIFSLVALGVYLSFRVLNFPDMSVDGTFPLGAALSAILIVDGVNPWLSCVIAMMAGALIGFVTGFVSTRLRVFNLLAGILSMTALYSINLRIMGKPNLSLFGEAVIFDNQAMVVLIAIVVGFGSIVYWFLTTEVGLSMRASGTNASMSAAQGINVERMTWLGLGISNALVALGGALFAQHLGFADINMGLGTIVIGLAAVLVGEALLCPSNVITSVIACIFGALLFRTIVAFSLNINGAWLMSSDLNLVMALLVGLATSFAQRRKALP